MGSGGPYCVVASNFAPGTTAADIEAVMAPIGGEMVSCKLAAAKPTVIAEMLFTEKTGAENVISMFNGKKVRPSAACSGDFVVDRAWNILMTARAWHELRD